MTDFSDRPFVAGSVIGLRAFAVDSLGRLMGPSFNQVFRPGDNEAECRKDTSPYSLGGYTNALMRSLYYPPAPTFRFWAGETTGAPEPTTLAEEAVETREAEKPKHTLGGLGCSCGFYAYYDGGNDYKQSNNVTAIIEGFGVCTVGRRGFRASKARLVALVEPGAKFPENLQPLIHRNYPDVPFYDRKRDALAAHPLTTPEVPTPADDDFWTRSA